MRSVRPGLFADDSIIRRVNRENVLLLGGGRALLMQLAHPKVAAGVDEHSDFRARPMYRLRRTVQLTMAIIYGDRETAMAAARSVNRAHARVVGQDYRATDPDLLLWVQATLVETALVTYEKFVRKLSLAEKEEFYQQSKIGAELLGLPRSQFPETMRDFDAYMSEMIAGGEVRVTACARDLATYVMRPRLRLVPGDALIPLDVVTAGLMPATLREQYGLPWSGPQRAAFRLFEIAVPKLVAVTPPMLRVWPLPGHNVKLSPDFSLTA